MVYIQIKEMPVENHKTRTIVLGHYSHYKVRLLDSEWPHRTVIRKKKKATEQDHDQPLTHEMINLPQRVNNLSEPFWLKTTTKHATDLYMKMVAEKIVCCHYLLSVFNQGLPLLLDLSPLLSLATLSLSSMSLRRSRRLTSSAVSWPVCLLNARYKGSKLNTL